MDSSGITCGCGTQFISGATLWFSPVCGHALCKTCKEKTLNGLQCQHVGCYKRVNPRITEEHFAKITVDDAFLSYNPEVTTSELLASVKGSKLSSPSDDDLPENTITISPDAPKEYTCEECDPAEGTHAADSACLTCARYLCRPLIRLHHERLPLHVVVSCAQLWTQRNSPADPPIGLCSQHNLPLVRYDRVCKTFLCANCTWDHATHANCSIDTAHKMLHTEAKAFFPIRAAARAVLLESAQSRLKSALEKHPPKACSPQMINDALAPLTRVREALDATEQRLRKLMSQSGSVAHSFATDRLSRLSLIRRALLSVCAGFPGHHTKAILTMKSKETPEGKVGGDGDSSKNSDNDKESSTSAQEQEEKSKPSTTSSSSPSNQSVSNNIFALYDRLKTASRLIEIIDRVDDLVELPRPSSSASSSSSSSSSSTTSSLSLTLSTSETSSNDTTKKSSGRRAVEDPEGLLASATVGDIKLDVEDVLARIPLIDRPDMRREGLGGNGGDGDLGARVDELEALFGQLQHTLVEVIMDRSRVAEEKDTAQVTVADLKGQLEQETGMLNLSQQALTLSALRLSKMEERTNRHVQLFTKLKKHIESALGDAADDEDSGNPSDTAGAGAEGSSGEQGEGAKKGVTKKAGEQKLLIALELIKTMITALQEGRTEETQTEKKIGVELGKDSTQDEVLNLLAQGMRKMDAHLTVNTTRTAMWEPVHHEHRAMSVNPGGTRLVMGDSTGRVIVYSTSDGRKVGVNGKGWHTDKVWETVWNRKGTQFATGSADGSVKIWQLNQETKQWDVLHTRTCSGPVTSVGWSPDDTEIVVSSKQIIEVYTLTGLASNNKDPRVTAPAPRQWQLRYTPDGTVIMGAGDDCIVRMYNTKTLELLQTMPLHNKSVWCALPSPSGNTMVTTDSASNLRVWTCDKPSTTQPENEAETKDTGVKVKKWVSKALVPLKGTESETIPVGTAWSVAWHPYLNYVAVGKYGDPTVFIISTDVVSITQRINTLSALPFTAVAWSPKGDKLFISEGGAISTYNVISQPAWV